jgi:predicted DCC family thiol-disulfide oxidoreductase YuxK
MANMYLENKMIIFDGVCLLCNTWVDFLIKHDKKEKLKFVAMQSEISRKLLSRLEYQTVTDTIVYFEKGNIFIKSTAVIRIAMQLGFPYSMMAGFYVIPLWIRDKIYDHIARNRYKWFGRKESCRIPEEEIRHRFLDESDF